VCGPLGPQDTCQQVLVYTSGQEAPVTPQIKREFKRRAAIEPVIGHLKEQRRLAETTLPMPAAMPSTPCSPPPATTFAAFPHG